MDFHKTIAALLCLLAVPLTVRAESKSAPSRLLLDDFESDPQGWTYIAGWEFPGAKGSLALGTIGGVGGRGRQLIHALRDVPGVSVVALCDVDRAILDHEVQ